MARRGFGIRLNRGGLQALAIAAFVLLAAAHPVSAGGPGSRIPDHYIPFKSADQLPPRTPPILELGDRFLGPGNLNHGFTTPAGAVWQPSFWVFGNFRTSMQYYSLGDDEEVSQWVNRLNLYGNLQLTGTERILVGIEPLHRDTSFTGEVFDSDGDTGFQNASNLRIRTLFFEGSFDELFPVLDPKDAMPLDIGLSFGRQLIHFQEGLLVNDTIDAIGIAKNNIRFVGVPWLSTMRIAGMWGWNEVHRDDMNDDPDADLFGLFTLIDTPKTIIEIDQIYVDSDDNQRGDLYAAGVGFTQRVGHFNTSLRYNFSVAGGKNTPQADDGQLIFTQVSWTPPHSRNVKYVNAYVGIDNFTSAARDANAGGPLGRTGILFEPNGLGNIPEALGNSARESYGIALGYQMFFKFFRRQLIIEAGARGDESGKNADAIAVAARLQQAFRRRLVARLDGFVQGQKHQELSYGLLTELQVKF